MGPSEAVRDQRVQLIAEHAQRVLKQLGPAKVQSHVNKMLVNFLGTAVDFRSFPHEQQVRLSNNFAASFEIEDLKAAANVLLTLCDNAHVTESRVAYFTALVAWVLSLLSVGADPV